jgi:GTP cyclohydrolase II
MDTVDANLALGHQADERDYTIAAGILQDLGVKSVRLLTNNLLKVEALRQLGIPVVRRVPLQTKANPDNVLYLQTKARRMNHLLNLNMLDSPPHNGHHPAEGPTPMGGGNGHS